MTVPVLNKKTQTQLRVRGYHLDGYGHVNNARYLEFMEEGRWAFFDDHPALVKQFKQQAAAFVVVNINIDYRQAAVEGDDLIITTGIVDVGKRSAVCHQKIFRADGTLVTEASFTFVLLDLRANKACAIEGEIGAVLEALTVAESALTPF
ncbi:thioesterase family protein [Vreelandella rituensis]|uniref:Acyl-CoA thioesterase n=1 Tax=Vreelandella rituensis TaxID=2282306 RepID=A0A368U910_9GAMM|nr:thioesterase family protein [Halomonas rituensis]RCV92592.1 acyl-CoA thioesterase [Halomonas rituensis]